MNFVKEMRKKEWEIFEQNKFGRLLHAINWMIDCLPDYNRMFQVRHKSNLFVYLILSSVQKDKKKMKIVSIDLLAALEITMTRQYVYRI